jgi:hypothetical protein
MAESGPPALTIREVRPDEYEALGFVRDTTRDLEFEPGEWLWSFVLRFEDRE